MRKKRARRAATQHESGDLGSYHLRMSRTLRGQVAREERVRASDLGPSEYQPALNSGPPRIDIQNPAFQIPKSRNLPSRSPKLHGFVISAVYHSIGYLTQPRRGNSSRDGLGQHKFVLQWIERRRALYASEHLLRLRIPFTYFVN